MGKGKSPNGAGSIKQRPDGRWYAALYVDTPLGRKRIATSKKSYEEADQWLTDKKLERRKGEYNFDADRLTVERFFRQWLDVSVEGVLARHTVKDYSGFVENHIVPAFGQKKLKNLKTSDLDALYRDKAKNGYSARTVRYLHTTLSKALSQAEAWDVVEKNVARHASPPKPEHKDKRALSAKQATDLLRVVKGSELEALFVLAITTGLRRGELLGLRWQDVELEGKPAVRVSRSLDYQYGEPVIRAPKRKASNRTVTLVPEAVASLKEHRHKQKEARLAAGPLWEGDKWDLVFCSRVGTPLSGDNITKRYLKPLLRAADCPAISFHELRHTFASLMLEGGEQAKVVQELLGHGSITTTLDTYSHLTEGMGDDAVRRMGSRLFEGG